MDLQHVSLLYTQGEMAAVAPIYDYDFKMLTETLSEASWRQLLFWLGPPGLLIGALALFTLKEPRSARDTPAPKKPFLRGALSLPFMSGVPPEPTPGLQPQQHRLTAPLPAPPAPALPRMNPDLFSVWRCVPFSWCPLFLSGPCAWQAWASRRLIKQAMCACCHVPHTCHSARCALLNSFLV